MQVAKHLEEPFVRSHTTHKQCTVYRWMPIFLSGVAHRWGLRIDGGAHLSHVQTRERARSLAEQMRAKNYSVALLRMRSAPALKRASCPSEGNEGREAVVHHTSHLFIIKCCLLIGSGMFTEH